MSVAVKKKSESCADVEHQTQPAEEQFGFEPLILSQADWDLLIETHENPPEPNEKLRLFGLNILTIRRWHPPPKTHLAIRGRNLLGRSCVRVCGVLLVKLRRLRLPLVLNRY